MTDILNYLLALSAIFFGYRIYGEKFPRNPSADPLVRYLCSPFMGNHRIHCIFQLKSQRHEKDKNRIHAVRIALLSVRICTRD